MASDNNDRSFAWYLAKEPIVLLVLTAIAVAGFLLVTGLSRIYRAQQESLGKEWFDRATADLNSGHLQPAVNDLHTALVYSRDNYSYQLSLAQTLAALNHTEEAYSYFFNLWQRQPENGTVNLDLARIFAKEGKETQALRYYHNAIYAVWRSEPEVNRRTVRLELINYLLRNKITQQAQAELIALAANLPEDSALHAQVAALFMQAEDFNDALEQYRQSLKLQRSNPIAAAGAGRAAFELGRYALARHYLHAAVSFDPKDEQSAELLKTANLVQKLDPYQQQASPSARIRLVISAFDTAGERLKACALHAQSVGSPPPTSAESDLFTRWNQMRPQITTRQLSRHPDLIDATMDLVFTIELETDTSCGTPTGADMALLLISKLHEGT